MTGPTASTSSFAPTLFYIKGSRLRTKIDLGMKTVKSETGKTNTPTLSMQIDGAKVSALKNQKALDILVEKETARIVELYRHANLESGHDLFDLTTPGQAKMKETVRNALTFLRSEMVAQGKAKAWSGHEMLGVDGTIPIPIFGNDKVGVSGKITAGITLGRVITLKFSFEAETKGKPARITPDKVEFGMSKTFATRLGAGISVGAKGTGVVTLGVDLGANVSTSRKTYTRLGLQDNTK